MGHVKQSYFRFRLFKMIHDTIAEPSASVMFKITTSPETTLPTKEQQ